MHGVGLRVALAGLVLVTVAACEPIYVLPGGALSSPEHPAPVQLGVHRRRGSGATRDAPCRPLFGSISGALGWDRTTTSHRAPGAKWAALVAEEPRVRLRSTGASFRCPHLPSPMPAEFDAVMAAIVAKYGMDPEVDFPPDVPVFRLEAR